MAKRFSATEIWSEDWFLEMEPEYKLFWHYILASCNHAGLFKVNIRVFNSINGVNIAPSKALDCFNVGKQRIRVITESLWLIEDFFLFQYGSIFNPKNRVHESIQKEYDRHNISIESLRGVGSPLLGDKDRVKDKDKDRDRETNTPTNSDLGTSENTVPDASEKKLPQDSGVLSTHQLDDGLHPIIISPNRPNGAPTVAEVIGCFAFLQAPERMRKFFEHYESSGWVDGMGRSIVMSWQSKASKWVSDDKAKEKTQAEKESKAAAAKPKKAVPYSPSPEDIKRLRNQSTQ